MQISNEYRSGERKAHMLVVIGAVLTVASVSGCQLIFDIEAPPDPGPQCGDGNVDVDEQCDDAGESPFCNFDCSRAMCGDGVTNEAADEVCDDGNRADGDGCSSDCRSDETCGNGMVDVAAGEECDDGGVQAGDGCNSACRLEYCGDGARGPDERCDDGNNQSGDGCSADCQSDETCGNGMVDIALGEDCDDGDPDGIDWCTATCAIAECGDGMWNADELDVDCGGHCGLASCRKTQECFADADCHSGWCHNGACGGVGTLVAFGYRTCAVLATGTIRCWSQDPPTDDIDLTGTVVQLALGYSHTCALLDTGAVRCWGSNYRGQLGYAHTDHTSADSAADVDIRGTAIQLAAGSDHTCALLSTGKVRCWGANRDGQLGYGHRNRIGDDEHPASAGNVAVGGTVVQIAAGDWHTCARLNTGAVRCWGDNNEGQLGYGHTDEIGDDEYPATAGDVAVGGPVLQIATGADHTCALLDTGSVRCWGRGNYYGLLGYGHTDNIGDDELPESVGDVDIGGPVTQISAGREHTCAVLESGAARCWGRGRDGMLGYGNSAHIGDNEPPSSVGDIDTGGPIVQITTGDTHTCALLSSGAVRCWGSRYRLGYGIDEDIGDNEPPSSAGDVDIGAPIL